MPVTLSRIIMCLHATCFFFHCFSCCTRCLSTTALFQLLDKMPIDHCTVSAIGQDAYWPLHCFSYWTRCLLTTALFQPLDEVSIDHCTVSAAGRGAYQPLHCFSYWTRCLLTTALFQLLDKMPIDHCTVSAIGQDAYWQLHCFSHWTRCLSTIALFQLLDEVPIDHCTVSAAGRGAYRPLHCFSCWTRCLSTIALFQLLDEVPIDHCTVSAAGRGAYRPLHCFSCWTRCLSTIALFQLLDEVPIGAKEAKRRRKMAEQDSVDQDKKDQETASSTPDYAAGLIAPATILVSRTLSFTLCQLYLRLSAFNKISQYWIYSSWLQEWFIVDNLTYFGAYCRRWVQRFDPSAMNFFHLLVSCVLPHILAGSFPPNWVVLQPLIQIWGNTRDTSSWIRSIADRSKHRTHLRQYAPK